MLISFGPYQQSASMWKLFRLISHLFYLSSPLTCPIDSIRTSNFKYGILVVNQVFGIHLHYSPGFWYLLLTGISADLIGVATFPIHLL